MQSISIRNLGPIKEFDYEIKDLTLLIGAQGSGKSTIAKAVFFFRTVKEVLSVEFLDLLSDGQKIWEWEATYSLLATRLLDLFGKNYFVEGTQVRYQYDSSNWAEFSKTEGRISFQLSNALTLHLEEILEQHVELGKDISPLRNRLRGLDRISKAIFAVFHQPQLEVFLPASRARLASTDARFDYFRAINKNIPDNQYFELIEWTRRTLVDFESSLLIKPIDSEKASLIEEARGLVSSILNGRLEIGTDEDQFLISEGQAIEIKETSSGQQEALWMVNFLLAVIIQNEPVHFILEEPEAHLHPFAQFQLCKLIALAINSAGSQAFITTHSPYIIAAINNLILAAKVGEEKPEETRLVVPDHFWMPCENIYAGEVQGGSVEDIMNRELQMIALERIDTVSSNINTEFDQLFQLEDIPLDPDFAAFYGEQAS